MRPGAGLYHIKIAGTGMCVHIPFRLNPIASLAWLGKHNEVLHLYRWYTHTRNTWRMDVWDILGRRNDQIGTL